MNSVFLVVLLVVCATISVDSRRWFGRRDKRDTINLDALAATNSSGAKNSPADLQTIYNQIYSQMMNGGSGSGTSGSDGDAARLTKSPEATTIAAELNGTSTNFQQDSQSGSIVNTGTAMGERNNVIQNGTFVEATSSGKGRADAATRSELQQTDMTVRGNVAAKGGSTSVRSMAGVPGNSSGIGGFSGVQTAAASGPNRSSSSTSLIINA